MIALVILAALQLCTQWTTQRVGGIPWQIKEASGVTISRAYPGRVYHVNDSGSEGVVYVTDLAGGQLQTIKVKDFKPKDMEDLRVADCGNGRSCLILADIGDNDRKRKTIELIVIEEPARLGATADIRYRVRMRYPDGPRDAESIAVHPDGTLFLLTKNGQGTESLFKLSRNRWQATGNEVRTLEAAGTINVKSILPNTDSQGLSPTSIDISDDGRRLLMLTYRDAVEFAFNVAAANPVSQPRRIPLQLMIQQEGVAYVPHESSFIYTSESPLFPSGIMKAACAK